MADNAFGDFFLSDIDEDFASDEDELIVPPVVVGARRDAGMVTVESDGSYDVRPSEPAAGAAAPVTMERLGVSELPQSLRTPQTQLAYRFAAGNGGAAPTRAKKPVRRGGAATAKAASGNALTSPMQGTIVKVAVTEGDSVAAGDLVVVLEAMKMEQPLTAHRSGVVTKLSAEVGATVTSGSTLCEIVDESA